MREKDLHLDKIFHKLGTYWSAVSPIMYLESHVNFAIQEARKRIYAEQDLSNDKVTMRASVLSMIVG